MPNVIKLAPVAGVTAGVGFDVSGTWTPHEIPDPQVEFLHFGPGTGAVVPKAVPGVPQPFTLKHPAIAKVGTVVIGVRDNTGATASASVVVAAAAPAATAASSTADSGKVRLGAFAPTLAPA